MGSVTGPHARTPQTRSQWVVGPGRTPQRMNDRGWESAQPRTPHTQARGVPPGRPHPAPTARKASWQERSVWGCDGSPRPHPPHPQPLASGPRPHAPKEGRSGVGERPTPELPHPGKGRPPPGVLVPPPQRAKRARRSARCGVGDGSHARTPRTHSQWVVGPGRTLQRRGHRGWGSARARTPRTQARGAPPPGALMPLQQRAKRARKSAHCGVGDGPSRSHLPQP